MKFVAWMAYHLESREIVDEYVRGAREALAGHELVVCEDLESIKREIADADAMIGWRITPEVFAEARKLKWIQFGSAGIDHTLFPELLESDVILTTLSGIHTTVVAEHVIALMLALSRRLDVSMRLQAEHRYERSEIASTAFELSGKTVGIVGLGKIGLSIARLAKAFGMRVVGTKRTFVPSLPNVDEVYAEPRVSGFGPDETRQPSGDRNPETPLDRILPVSDFLVLVVPLTEDTRTLLGRDEIARMKHGAYLVNVARGAMVDHDALGEALRSGKLAGAALDVFPQEPLPPESPIWDFPNTILTPHTGGSHPGYSESAAAIFRQNLQAFLSGGEMVNVYRREREY